MTSINVQPWPLWMTIFAIGAAASFTGCILGPEGGDRMDLGVDPVPAALANSAAYRDTIGAASFYDGLAPIRLRGYGLVVGLGQNGSSDCPEPVRSQVIQDMYKQHDFRSPVVGTDTITPEQLVDDIDTAVVLVEGQMPGAAVKGARFDVAVRALPGTSTKSLRGGRLYTADLRPFRPVSPQAVITGKVRARAHGPVFLNPFADDNEAATRTPSIEGIVIGGASVTQPVRVRLVLSRPSYALAKQIQDRINNHFPQYRHIAVADTPSYLKITIPPEYKEDPDHFLALLRALYLSRNPTFEATRARELALELKRPNAPHELIALCFETLGRTALPELNELYADPADHVSFHAAAAGLFLDDHLAVDAMAIHAEDPDSPFRFQAIRTLGAAKGMASATLALRRVLNDPDPRVKTAAYEALVERNDTSLRSVRLSRDNFTLDTVPCKGEPFIYAKRSDERRLALFCDSLYCTPPVFYRSPDDSITLTADKDDETITLIRVSPMGRVSPPIPGSTNVYELVRLMGNEAGMDGNKVTGLGLDYGAVVRVIYNLTRDGVIPTDFVLETPNTAELFGPQRREGRPESDL